VLWKYAGGVGTFALPSPDGRHLAMMGWTNNSNIGCWRTFEVSMSSFLPDGVGRNPSV